MNWLQESSGSFLVVYPEFYMNNYSAPKGKDHIYIISTLMNLAVKKMHKLVPTLRHLPLSKENFLKYTCLIYS